jgi:hypothetical protein
MIRAGSSPGPSPDDSAGPVISPGKEINRPFITRLGTGVPVPCAKTIERPVGRIRREVPAVTDKGCESRSCVQECFPADCVHLFRPGKRAEPGLGCTAGNRVGIRCQDPDQCPDCCNLFGVCSMRDLRYISTVQPTAYEGDCIAGLHGDHVTGISKVSSAIEPWDAGALR